MKKLRWAIGSSFFGVLFAGTAMAQATMSFPVQQPNSIQQMTYQTDGATGYALADPAPAAAPAAAPASPSNVPPAPPAAKADAKPAAEKPKDEEKKDEEKKPDDTPPAPSPVKLFHGPWLDCEHLDIRGFFDVGTGLNPASPITRFNGPVGYDDRSNELQLNQLDLTAERLTKIENDCGEDYGYRADVLYGTDRRFIQTVPGTDWDGSLDAGNRFYGVCIPQLYGDFAINKLLLRGGHFYAPLGYEVANADANFFYSHTYQFLYAEPTTLTGGYGTYKVKDKLLVNVGMDTGWNEGFKSLSGKPNFFFGVNWTSPDKDGKLNVIEEVLIGNTQPAGVDDSTRILFNTVITAKLGDKWTYVNESNFANDSDTPLAAGGTGSAAWWGMTNYLLYNINDCWGFGARYEYFEDINGAVVTQVGPPTIAETGSKWNDVTLGLNWKPNLNVTMRSEVRWDWASNNATGTAKPFAGGTSDGQFLWGNDVVIRF